MEAAIRKTILDGAFIPAIPLALDRERKFNEKRQRALVRYYLDAGVGGIAVAVHTTQFQIRDPKINLFETVLRVTSEEIKAFEARAGRSIIKISGVCGKLEQVVSETELAKRYGYDAVLLSPSGLQALTEDECLARAEAVGAILPFFGFYLQPAAGGRLFSFDFWSKLCENPSMVAIKIAPFNRYQTMDVVRAVALSSRSQDIALYTGNDDNILLDLITPYRFTENGKTVEKRFVGGLLGHWSVWTKASVDMFAMVKQAVRQGGLQESLLTLAMEVTDANAVLFDAANGFSGCIPGVHEILRRQGLFDNIFTLDEQETLSPGQAQEIDRIYRMYPHLNDDAFVKENLEKWFA